MSLVLAIDTLRGRFMRLRRGRPLGVIMESLPLHRLTVKKFIDGGNVSMKVIELIDLWCDHEEGMDATSRTRGQEHDN